MSWEDLEDIEESEDIRSAMQSREDLNKLCHRVFSTEDGQAFLLWLKEMYVDVSIAAPGNDPSHAFFAEGQRNVVRNIMARIQAAKNM